MFCVGQCTVEFLGHVPNSLATAGRYGKLQSGLFFSPFCVVFILLLTMTRV